VTAATHIALREHPEQLGVVRCAGDYGSCADNYERCAIDYAVCAINYLSCASDFEMMTIGNIK